eukprot:TRINITY_DN5574_c0_g2_i1.p1 TRINITY_DN5574_c0_g2~~TRINITY_DN5574_c0_g2_i1.p1  ORF type:complete len:316 (-),score=45.80 TRINITY_DN5574_c0_g2_i1:13-960(-)
MPTEQPVPSGQQGFYMLGKCAFLFAYYAMLSRAGLANDVRFKVGLFTVLTPLVKFYCLFERAKTRALQFEFVLSVLHDQIRCACFWFLATSCQGQYYFLFVFGVTISQAVLEYAHYRILNFRNPGSEGSFVVKLGGGLQDQLLTPIVATWFYFLGTLWLDFDRPITSSSFLVYVAAVYASDLVFGSLHFLTHCWPWLWKKHAIHHQYKRQDLNSFANFYTEFLDGLLMNCSMMAIGGVVALTGDCSYIMSDLLFTAALSHLSLIHISEPTRLLSISYAVFCLKKKKKTTLPRNIKVTIDNILLHSQHCMKSIEYI